MAINRYLELNSTNDIAEKAPVTSSTGATDGGKLVALDETTGRLDVSMMPAEITPECLDVVASESLVAGNYVNIFNSSGTLKVRKADASAGVSKKADGYVLDNYDTDDLARVYKDGLNNALSSLTIGGEYYLSNTVAGGLLIKASAPTTATHLLQRIGIAKSATELLTEIDVPIIRA